MKYISLILIIVLMMSGCGLNTKSSESEKQSAVSEEASQNNEPSALGSHENRVKSVGTSYKELEALSSKNRNELSEFDIELCYFKMKNIPDEYIEVYASIWEIGFFADYENPETEERIEFNWWANKKPEEYAEQIKDVPELKVLSRNGVDYYCYFVKIGEEKKGNTPYHAAIRWIEDDKCFYIQVLSATPLDESVLEYCEIEKFTID